MKPSTYQAFGGGVNEPVISLTASIAFAVVSAHAQSDKQKRWENAVNYAQDRQASTRCEVYP